MCRSLMASSKAGHYVCITSPCCCQVSSHSPGVGIGKFAGSCHLDVGTCKGGLCHQLLLGGDVRIHQQASPHPVAVACMRMGQAALLSGWRVAGSFRRTAACHLSACQTMQWLVSPGTECSLQSVTRPCCVLKPAIWQTGRGSIRPLPPNPASTNQSCSTARMQTGKALSSHCSSCLQQCC